MGATRLHHPRICRRGLHDGDPSREVIDESQRRMPLGPGMTRRASTTPWARSSKSWSDASTRRTTRTTRCGSSVFGRNPTPPDRGWRRSRGFVHHEPRPGRRAGRTGEAGDWHLCRPWRADRRRRTASEHEAERAVAARARASGDGYARGGSLSPRASGHGQSRARKPVPFETGLCDRRSDRNSNCDRIGGSAGPGAAGRITLRSSSA